ncbi:MAG: NUDIX hydrolase, partial [Oscillospiraceae bacterium]
MDFTEQFLSREEIFHGHILDVHVDTVRLPSGKTATREVADHPGGVGILALDGRDNVVLVTQYRYVFGRTLLEIPAGKLEPGEDPASAAIRELREETGAVPDEFLPMGKLFASPGCYGETLWLFLARGLTFGETQPDEDEFLAVERIPFDEAVHRVMAGEIEDAKTVAAL